MASDRTTALLSCLSSFSTSGETYADDEVEIAESVLKDAGWKILGSGSYGLAVADPESRNKCYKISLSETDPWRDWIRMCQRRAYYGNNRKFMPIVYGVLEFDDVFVAHMRRYQHSKSEYLRDDLPQIFCSMLAQNCPRGMREDMHMNNVMWDPLLQVPVVTDPWAHACGSSYHDDDPYYCPDCGEDMDYCCCGEQPSRRTCE